MTDALINVTYLLMAQMGTEVTKGAHHKLIWQLLRKPRSHGIALPHPWPLQGGSLSFHRLPGLCRGGVQKQAQLFLGCFYPFPLPCHSFRFPASCSNKIYSVSALEASFWGEWGVGGLLQEVVGIVFSPCSFFYEAVM